MTAEQLAAAMRIKTTRAALWVTPITWAMAEYEIDTPARQAAWLAQIGHESGGLVWVREIWGPTPAQSRYEGRLDLGNTEPGDGKRFMGRGLIQITGRANYEVCGRALDLPLDTQPELLEEPRNAARSAGWFWWEHGCNALADSGQFQLLTRRINGGLNGLPDREARLAWALEVLA